MTRPLLRLLILAWSRPPDRRFVRTKLNFDLRVVAGLHSVYGNLQAEDSLPYSTTRTPVFSLDETDSPEAGARRKIRWSSGSLENVHLAPLDSELATDSLFVESQLEPIAGLPPSRLDEFGEASDAPATTEHEHEPHAVKTVNESAGGYCIRWQGDGIPRVKIGELIGVESPADRSTYGLGVIRWMKRVDEKAIDLGLEVISTRCEAADVREKPKAAKRDAPSFKCLVVTDSDPASNSTASLIMSTMSLQTGTDLLLSRGGQEQLIRLTRLVEFSSAFARYHFESVATSEAEPNSGERPGDEFNDLWGNL